MRTYKFRAYEPISKRMFEVDGLSFRNQYVTDEGGQNTWGFNQVRLMQFIELLDKQGKEIYEFDWLSDGTSHPMLVVWDRYGWFPFTKNTMIAGKMEVIGNKYENGGEHELE